MNLNSLPESVRLAIEAAQNKKASGLSVLDLREVGGFTSYFVICTGFSTPQVQAICSASKLEIPDEPEGPSRRGPVRNAAIGGAHPPGEAVSK